MKLFEILLLIFVFSYTLLLIFLMFVSIFYSRPRKKSHSSTQNVSIVIPIKNESQNLPMLLSSLEALEAPSPFEVIFVDDESTDNSVEIISNFKLNSKLKIKIIKNEYPSNRHLTSKQLAIDLGIRNAEYPLIALTDADIILDKRWLVCLLDALTEDIELVFGHTIIKTDGKLFSFLQAFQLEFLFSFASVFSYCGITGSCMGNNLLIRKESYISSGGFDTIGYTVTEDRALLYNFKKQRRGIAATFPFIPTASTYPHKSYFSFIDQVYRWARGGFTYGKNLFYLGLFFAIQNLIFIFSSVNIVTFYSVKIIAIINFFILWLFLIITFVKNEVKSMALFFPLYYIFLLIESIVLGFYLLVNKKVVWKGREI